MTRNDVYKSIATLVSQNIKGITYDEIYNVFFTLVNDPDSYNPYDLAQRNDWKTSIGR